MEAISSFVKVQLPNYLKNLPIPNSVDGIGKLTGSDIAALAPFFLTVCFLLYAVVKLILPGKKPKPPRVNYSIKLDSPKVADPVDIEDLDKDKVAYCRCWRSSKFPICDGTHNKHNEETGDNVGPLVLKRKAKN